MLDHTDRQIHVAPRTKPGRVDVLMRIGGADQDIASSCSSFDRRLLRGKGALLVAALIPSMLVWTVGLSQLTGTTTTGLTMAALISMAIVLTIFVYDCGNIAAAWLRSGRRQLEARGALEPVEATLGDKAAGLVAFLPRLLLPFASAAVGTALALTVALAPDIEAWQREEDLRRNAASYAAAEQIVRSTIAAAERQLADARNHQQQAAAERARLLDTPAGAGAAQLEREIAAIASRRDVILTQLASIEGEASQRDADASAERTGVRLRTDHSGRAGNGPLAQFHAERAAQLRGEARRLAAEAAELDTRINALRDQHRQERQQGAQAYAARLAATEQRLAEAVARVDAAASDLRALSTNQGRMVREQAQALPGYVAPADGLAGRLQGLHGFAMTSPSSAMLVFGAELLLIGLELLGVLAALRLPPTGFSLRLAMALEEEVRACSFAAFEQDLAARMRNAMRDPGP